MEVSISLAQNVTMAYTNYTCLPQTDMKELGSLQSSILSFEDFFHISVDYVS